MKTAMVTGGKGFIGSHAVAALEGAGYKVFSLDAPFDLQLQLRQTDVRFDLVVHCAAVVGGRRVMDWTPIQHAANLAIDAALFAWAERTKPGRVVYFSSSCAYPVALGQAGHALHEDGITWPPAPQMMPDKLYGWAKLTGELMAITARDAGVPVSIVRPFSVYGPGMKEGFAIRGFAEQIQRRADPIEVWGDAGQVRDFIHVSDVCRAVLLMAGQGISGPVNLGTGRGTSLTDLVAMMSKAAGYSPQVKVAAGMPAGVPSLVADNGRLREFYRPSVTLERYFAETLSG